MSRMPRRLVPGTIGVLLCCLAPAVASAQDVKLYAQCGSPAYGAPASSPPRTDAPAAGTQATVSCNLWVTDAAVFKGVKASIKGRSDQLSVQFEPRNQSFTAIFMMQLMDPSRRVVVTPMRDAVLKIADPMDTRHRYAVYTVANDLNKVVDFDAAKADFDKQVRAVRTSSLPTQLYKGALEAIGKLAKERGDRKALIILGDGNSDDQSYEHEQVVKAAKDAGVVIHALGFAAEAADQPKFQNIRRLAEDTGGFRREVRVGNSQKYTIGKDFAQEALENGGNAVISLKEPAGPVTLNLTADFTNGRSETTQVALTVPPPAARETAPAPRSSDRTPAPVEPPAWHERLWEWAQDNKTAAVVSGLAFTLGTIGLALFGLTSYSARRAQLAAEAAGGPVYGWLDMLDGNASRYALQTTNIRIGRHRDNDICLINDSISRRHAVLHFDADRRKFVITDLGGGNGVVVTKGKQQSHDLNDGDLVELGEVRLRFRSNEETVG